MILVWLYRLLRAPIAILLVLLGLSLIGAKLWMGISGPFIEALPAYDYCGAAEQAFAGGRSAEALELAEAGACDHTRSLISEQWDSLAAHASRCLEGIWTGEAEDATGVGCAIASDLVVFGDVRDLTRQGLAWGRGEDTDPVLITLSAAGLALTFAPHVGAGNALLKVARRAGTLTGRMIEQVGSLLGRRAWRPLADLFGDAGRIAQKLGPAGGARAMAYADTPAELADLARFVDTAREPLLSLRWAGKGAVRISDDAAHTLALSRGPQGVQLLAQRGGAALLTRQPLVIALAKSLYRHPDHIAAALLWLLRSVPWVLVLGVGGALTAAGLVTWPRRRRRRSSAPALHPVARA